MTRKTVLITGASAGIGAATARLAAKHGYNVALHYHTNLKGAQLVAQLAERLGATTCLLQGDMGNPQDVERIFAEFEETFPRLDAVVNNAGQVDVPARVDEMSAERLQRMMNVNLVGPILVAKEAVLRMSTSYGGDGGVIINISSAAARLGSANQYVDYAASKAGINILTKGLSDEVANEGIRVSAIAPGIIETAIHAKGGLPDRADDMAPMVPMKRAGSAEECAEAILFLMSDSASYVTGTVLDVTGGR